MTMFLLMALMIFCIIIYLLLNFQRKTVRFLKDNTICQVLYTMLGVPRHCAVWDITLGIYYLTNKYLMTAWNLYACHWLHGFKYKLVCTCMCVSHFNHVWLFMTLWSVAHQEALSVEFSKQEYWSGLPCPSPVNWNIGSKKRCTMLILVNFPPTKVFRNTFLLFDGFLFCKVNCYPCYYLTNI